MSGLDRVAKLYAKVEQARLVEVRAAAFLCEEVKLLRQQTFGGAHAQGDAARAAFAAGDCAQRTVSETVRAATLVHAQRLTQLLGEREVALDVAEAVYRESRLQAEQIGKVVAGARVKEATEEARRAQAAADDRYGSRLRWRQAQGGDERRLM